MPPDAPGQYFIARIRGGDVAAVGSQPEGAPPEAIWNTYVWVDRRRRDARRKVRDAGGTVLDGAVRRRWTRAGWRCFADPEGAAFCVWQAKEHRGATDRQRARLAELQRPQHPRRRAARGASTARCSAGRRSIVGGGGRCGRCPATATTSSERTPGLRERMAEVGAPDGFEDVVATPHPDRRRPARRRPRTGA